MIALLTALLATQERIDLNPPLETWYKVVQGSRQVGYFHETWRRSPSRWRYEYGFEGEFELPLRGKPHAEDVNVTAFLDEAFMPVELLMEAFAHASHTRAREMGRGALRREAQPGSVRGRPNRGKLLLSANQVMAEISEPARVSTNIAYGRAVSVLAIGT